VNVPVERALRVAGARALNAAALPPSLKVATDSRTLSTGDTFLALRGERFDGHRFVAEALERGAAAVVVDDAAAVPEGAPALLVSDTRSAYLALAAQAREMLAARVVAITGSTGKTTTKALLEQLLRCAGERVAATPGNENNEIGVSKLFLGLDPGVSIVVVEFGARHYGDIAPLVAVARPDVAILTNVGDAHLAIMGSPERLAETKWGIFASGAQAVLNASDETSVRRARTLDNAPWWFATSTGADRVKIPEPCAIIVGDPFDGADELARIEAGRVERAPIECRLPGEHNRRNLAAACAATFALGAGAGVDGVAAAIPGLALPGGRYERARIGDLEVIFDAYNASMAGTLATLDAFSRERGGRRIAVLASMAELGDGSPAMHERVGAAAARADVAALLVGGEHAADLARGAREAGLDADRLVPFERNADAVRWLRTNARAGDLVLLKGSRMYRLEEIVELLRSDAK
jgi:UDP-N-acetylmuramoyl-tripeptide--D-alanyl-D-alanine ligase